MHTIAVKKKSIFPRLTRLKMLLLLLLLLLVCSTVLCLNSLSFVRKVVYDFYVMFILEEREYFVFFFATGW